MNKKLEILKKEIETMRGKYSTGEIFRDWIEITANSFNYSIKGDARTLNNTKELCSRYTTAERTKFAELTKLLLEICEEEMGDHLGTLYMQLGISDKGKAQVFTPYHIGKSMASMTYDKDEFENKEVITVNDPACGSGALLVAFCDVLKENGIDYKNRTLVVAQDLDDFCCKMCFIQLNLFDVPALIKQGDSLTEPFNGEIDKNTYVTGRFIRNDLNLADFE